MEYDKSILPSQPAYYVLNNASIVDGLLTIDSGGSATCTLNDTNITKLTEYFRVALVASHFTNNYYPRVRAQIHIQLIDDTFYNFDVYPTFSETGVATAELKVKASEYKNFTFTVTSDESISFSLWELCPEAASEDVEVIIDGVKQSLPRLLFDYNTWPLLVEQAETTISLITFRLLDNTDLQGHLEMSYTASTSCTLVLRFKDNGATELFSPLTYDLNAGRGSIGVPHAYLTRLAGIHSVTITAQITTGTLAIDTRGIMFTIDGGYLAERMLDIGMDMRDISIRQLSEDYGPDEIWIAGIEAGEAIIRKRPYNEKTNITFEPLFSLGKALDVAIEFDGDWVLRPLEQNYTIETYELPWVFWIDEWFNLWAQIGNDSATQVLLDTEVDDLSVVRGYKSNYYVTQDQGLICCYIKLGKVYYRQYVYNDLDGQYAWRDIYLLSDDITEELLHVNVQRLNDYRISVTMSSVNNNYWYITDRTFVGQATPPETVSFSITPFALPAILPWDYVPEPFEVNTLFRCDGDWRKKDTIYLEATFNYDIRYLSNYPLQEFIYDPIETGYTIKNVIIDTRKITFILSGPVLGTMNITPNSFALQYYVPNVGYYPIPKEVWRFIPYRIEENVTFNISNISFISTMRGIQTSVIEASRETVSFNMNNITFNCIPKKVTDSLIVGPAENISFTIKNIFYTWDIQYVGDQPI